MCVFVLSSVKTIFTVKCVKCLTPVLMTKELESTEVNSLSVM